MTTTPALPVHTLPDFQTVFLSEVVGNGASGHHSRYIKTREQGGFNITVMEEDWSDGDVFLAKAIVVAVRATSKQPVCTFEEYAAFLFEDALPGLKMLKTPTNGGGYVVRTAGKNPRLILILDDSEEADHGA